MNKPTKRQKAQILKRAANLIDTNLCTGCCAAIIWSIRFVMRLDCGPIWIADISKIFPRFQYHYAEKYFEAYQEPHNLFWWPPSERKLRLSFIKWLGDHP